MILKNGVYYNSKNNKIYLVTDLRIYLDQYFGLVTEFNICGGAATEKVIQYRARMLEYVIYLGAL